MDQGAGYNDRLFSKVIRKFFNLARFHWAGKSLQKMGHSPQNVVEVGCFDGKLIGFLPKKPLRYVGYDAKPHILYLATQGILGGPRTHINHLIAHLGHEYRISVAVGERDLMNGYIENPDITLYKIHSLIRPISICNDLKALWELIRLIRTLKPDLVSTHSSKAGVLGRIAAKICGIPVIFTAHGWAFTEGVPENLCRFYIQVERFMARFSDKIICVSEHDRQLAIKHNVGKDEQLVTIRNAMPYNLNDQLAQARGENPVHLIMVARFCEQKDYELFLKVLAALKTAKEYCADLVGDGPILETMKTLARELGLGERVRFLGARTDVPALLTKAQVFVLVSHWEGFPRSILEAMRAGLPVVASDVGGVNEAIVDGETGFLIPRGDFNVLADRLKTMIEDAPLRTRLAQNGHRRFMELYRFEGLLEKTVQVYSEVIETRRVSKARGRLGKATYQRQEEGFQNIANNGHNSISSR